MQLTHLGHACVLVEIADERFLIDPGTLASDFTKLTELSAVFITHQHADHLDPDRLPHVAAVNPEAEIWCDPMTEQILRDRGVRANTLATSPTHVGPVTITPVGEQHAVIHDEVPRITNVGLCFSADGEPTFFHPGDALDGEPGPVDVLAFPLNAPWAASRDMTGFVRRIAAPTAFPIHDGLLNATGRNLYLNQADRFGSRDTEIVDLCDGATRTFG